MELELDACETASEKTDEVEEEAEEERGAAYGWVSGKKPCLGRGISRLMFKEGCTGGNLSREGTQ